MTGENRFEEPDKYFHPLLGTMITSGARLFLTMAEAKLKELGAIHAYMDTDSVFVPPEKSQEIMDFFQPLNPYNLDIQLLKPEKKMSDFMESPLKDMLCTLMRTGKSGSWKMKGPTCFTGLDI